VVKPDMTVELRKVVVARIDGDHAVLSGNSVAKDEKVAPEARCASPPAPR